MPERSFRALRRLGLAERQRKPRPAGEARRLRDLADAALEGILIHRDGVVLDANTALCRMLGRERADLVGREVSGFVTPDEGTVGTGSVPAADCRVSLTGADGIVTAAEFLPRAGRYLGRPASVVSVRGTGEQGLVERRIQHVAQHDALTGLPNRILFNERLTQALELSARTGDKVAVFCLNLDRFKPVNELLGHQGGDEVLIQVANRLRAVTRAVDTVCRFGGDEFAVLQILSNDTAGASHLAHRLMETLSQPYSVDGQPIEIGVSMGIALHPGDGDSPTRLLRNAGTALDQAKGGTCSGYQFFEAAMNAGLQDRRKLEQDLRRAVARGELDLHYQPLVNCNTDQVAGFEALLRWTHPDRGPISPGTFIPLAEETRLISDLGRWVLETACAEAAGWQDPCRIAVNMSPAQFHQPDLPAMVADILSRTGLPPQRLELEVTEGLLIGDTERALRILKALKSQGVRISLDDFGTGYSSLSYLRRFPFDKIKIDRSFVNALGSDESADAIVRAIVGLGHSLHLDVTAEGVETTAQLDMLRAQRCHEVQGYLLGRPTHRSGLFRLSGLAARSRFGRVSPAIGGPRRAAADR